MPGETNLTVRISPDLKKQVGEEAKRQDRSKAWIVIAAIRQYLGKDQSNENH